MAIKIKWIQSLTNEVHIKQQILFINLNIGLTISFGLGGNLGPFNNTFRASGGNIGGGNEGGGNELSIEKLFLK